MTDLVERLRACQYGLFWPEARDAISEISRLQKEIETARRYVETVHGGPGPDATDEEWMSYDAAKEAAFQAMCAALKDKEVAG